MASPKGQPLHGGLLDTWFPHSLHTEKHALAGVTVQDMPASLKEEKKEEEEVKTHQKAGRNRSPQTGQTS